MWLNQRTIDGIRVMAALAIGAPRLVKAADLATETNITLMNVQKTVNALERGGLINTSRGRNGGMILSRPSDTIMISEIVRIFEPTDCPVHFLMRWDIDSKISHLVFEAHREFFAKLSSKSLHDLIK